MQRRHRRRLRVPPASSGATRSTGKAPFAGLDRRTSWIVGIGLNARGIMELVIANIAYKAGLISTEVFSILVIMGVLTTLTTPLMLKRGFRRLAAAEAPAVPAA